MTQEVINFISTHKAHIASGLGGGGAMHLLHTIMPWLKANGTLRGVWRNYIWSKPVIDPPSGLGLEDEHKAVIEQPKP